ncbi:hypothetical protein ILYODFUR_009203, partial [Ilyodon furcidens]
PWYCQEGVPAHLGHSVNSSFRLPWFSLSSGSSRVTGHCFHPVSSSGDQVGLLELR